MTTGEKLALVTADQLLHMPDGGSHHELELGRLITVTPAVFHSGVVSGLVLAKLASWTMSSDLGHLGSGKTGFHLTSHPDTVRVPDVWFVRTDRLPTKEAQWKFFPGAPDLAVEVLSPSDRFTAVVRKVHEYLEHGARLVWVIDPEARTAGIFRPGVTASFIDEGGALDGEDVLPGLSFPLRDVLV